MIQFGVVQDGRVLVERDNVAVRHVGIAMTGGGQVRLVDVELAHAGLEGFMRRTVTVYRGLLRFTHAVKFVVGFIRAVIVEVIQHPFRVELVCRNIQA